MEAIYSTEKVESQTLQDFNSDVTYNIDRWILLITRKRDQQRALTNVLHLTNSQMRHAIEESMRQLNQQLELDYPPSMKDSIRNEIESLESRKNALESSVIHPSLKVNYDKYLETLEDIKRIKTLAKSGVKRSPQFVQFPTLLTTKAEHGRWKKPTNGHFGIYIDKKTTFPMTLLAYSTLLKAQYPRYVASLAKSQEKELTIPTNRFNTLLEETLSRLQAYDVLYTRDTCGGDGCLYVYSGEDNTPYVRPTLGKILHYLPQEALPMLKEFDIHTSKDLRTLYAGCARISGIAPTNMKGLLLYLADSVDSEDQQVMEICLNGHTLYVDREIESKVSRRVIEALENDGPIPTDPDALKNEDADSNEDEDSSDWE